MLALKMGNSRGQEKESTILAEKENRAEVKHSFEVIYLRKKIGLLKVKEI